MRTKKFLSLLLSAAMAFSLLTATAFAAAPAEEENGFFDFLLGKKYTYLYAALTWDEYWANEKVYAAGSTAASAQLDSHEEQDLGAFDAVSRATANHGLHRGSFQSTAVIYAKDGSTYTVSHWSDDGKTIYLADGTTVGWNRGTITKADGSTVQMDHYEVLGTKYVPVRVATSDLADFCSKYTVVENGGQLVGGYSEKNLTAYTLTAAVDKNTNGLKYAIKSGDGYTFSAAHNGTGSGVAEAAQKAAEGLTVNLRSGQRRGQLWRVYPCGPERQLRRAGLPDAVCGVDLLRQRQHLHPRQGLLRHQVCSRQLDAQVHGHPAGSERFRPLPAAGGH